MLITLNQTQCRRIAEILAQVEVPRAEEENQLSSFTNEEIANFYFLLVAICHQTQELRGTINGRPLRGWDYLSQKLRAAAELDKTLLDPEHWTSMTSNVLASLFADSKFGETLSDVSGRVRLIRDLGVTMNAERWTTTADLYVSAGARVSSGLPNLMALIGKFLAYQDPVFKKTYFFLGLMSSSSVWEYVDPEHVGAPVDYHEVRGHLRLGTVQILESELQERLFKGVPVSEQEDIAIRSTVHEAIVYISEMLGGVNPMELHYLFWNIFRSICKRVTPLCHLAQDSTLPLRYTPLLKLNGGSEQCPFACVCPSADLNVRYVEHQFKTEWY